LELQYPDSRFLCYTKDAMKGGIFKKSAVYIREIVFGFEDSLVSTLGAITGIAAGTGSGPVIILSGVVLVVVEAISMSSGSYLSSKSAKEVFDARQGQDHARILQERLNDEESMLDVLKKKKFSDKQIAQALEAFGRERKLWMKEASRCEHRLLPATGGSPIVSGIIMGLFYIVGGMFPLMPYLLFPIEVAIYYSVIITGVVLFILGIVKAKIVSGHWLKSGMEMTTVALTATLLGFIIGRVLSSVFDLSL